MKALILVGGFGTRLRPLTLSSPKPLVEFANEPMILHQLKALKKVGVYTVVMACQYKAQLLEDLLGPLAEEIGIQLQWSIEKVPMGTAGPIALAYKYLQCKTNEPFFVLNSDITCTFPFQEMLDFHLAHKKSGTIAVTQVSEPSKYGVVVMKPNGQIERFVEKPKVFVGNKINAGIYLLNPSVLGSYIETENPIPTSIERHTFPKMVQSDDLFAFSMPGFWMDIGQPRDYLTGTTKYLAHLTTTNKAAMSPTSASIKGNVLIHPTAKIGKNCFIGPNVVIGPNCAVADGVRLSDTVLLRDSKVGSHSWLKNTIVGWKSQIGKWTRLQNYTVLGEAVTVQDEIYMNGVAVLPHKSIKESIASPKVVM